MVSSHRASTLSTLLLLLTNLTPLSAQSLTSATSGYTQLSQFRALLASNPSLVPSNSSTRLTVLIPSDAAFDNFTATTGKTVQQIDAATLANYFNYHTIDGELEGLQSGESELVDTQLTGEVYDLRNGTEGQVLVLQGGGVGAGTSGGNSTGNGTNTHAIVKSGAGYQVNMDVINGAWTGGNFEIVDGFLTLPKTCTDTMADKANGYTALIGALERSNLTTVLNTFPNVTCLAPNNAAFNKAGDPDLNLPVSDLAAALEYHTLVGAQYSTTLEDGNIYKTANGMQVQVSVKDNGTLFFNDAMVLKSDVITNNWVIHVLDRVMSVMNFTSTSTSSSASSSATSPASSSTAGGPSTTSATSSSASTSATHNAAAGKIAGIYLPAVLAVAAFAI